MTDEQRDTFIRARVQQILEAYNETYVTLSKMDPRERDMYVHKRIERDLIISQAMLGKLADYIRERTTAWRDIVILDIVGFALLVWLAYHDIRDLVGFIFIAGVLVASRIYNYRLRKKATTILGDMQAHIERETNTATLDFLVDEIPYVNGDAALMRKEVGALADELNKAD